jgi:methyltransferase (TIGR00027 family)
MSADKRPASRTAAMVAAYRARAARRHDALVRDPWADKLCGEHGFELAERFDRAFPHMELWMELRTRYLDLVIQRALTSDEWGMAASPDSPGQVVILGAGFDARSARLADIPARFFEVDQPESQREKLEALERAGYPKERAVYVSCDFEHEEFLDRLTASGFDPAAPAVVLWEGVTPYLTEAAVRATLTRLASACHERTVLAFDYVEKRMIDSSAKLNESALATRDMVKDVGEPVTFGVNDPLEMLYECGFRHVETVTFNDIALSLTGTYDRVRQFRFQHIAVACRTPPRWLR